MDNTSSPCDKELPGTRDSVATIIVLCLLAVLVVLAVAGNTILILAIIACKRLRNLANLFVLSRAVADLIVGAVAMPFSIYKFIHNDGWELGHQLCLLFFSFNMTIRFASVHHLLIIAVHRYIVICHPGYHGHMGLGRVLIMLSACWLIPLSITFVPMVSEWHTIGMRETIPCYPFEKQCIMVYNLAFVVICSLAIYFIPAMIMVFCHVKLRVKTKMRVEHCRRFSVISTELSDVNMARTLSILMACFGLCWTPLFLGTIIDRSFGSMFTYDLRIGFFFLTCFNSVLNPFVYYLSSSHFRNNIHKLIMCELCCSRDGVIPIKTLNSLMNTQRAEVSDTMESDSLPPLPTVMTTMPTITATTSNVTTTLPTATVIMPNATTTK
ncbi:5-hydroxytryptamine receptor 4-like isoform X2 [Gigantopelta aegis]|uniref:5-hydroxytryptamine receptor 4-like isoform X2 n=1 Tax=Gigantopelta aegis TaxID=1735272 RepID=UPI001B88AA05|nr:5-hydroxytryptamine receptor 4-like isoform X2 [Gigantopelta aegis]XP_041371444.1 5-hydroxytryptamine receptor 4-like isoform X2 [Gigantopelta aegis]XP_041371446.1 5-hydroxytryptamine receptor 4-like isoform X2 [Gigantopelta aegis]XP_041371447.1 5-hydroxytryptamine receptor 4-like isoform X2 [Gigantopelta aegis]XP_041371448.1 5-hydroxytryptamine receptor 4-like isoform X2 [Gigantopelta aegis]